MLKPIQHHAAVLLAGGLTQAATATQLNVHPETIRNYRLSLCSENTRMKLQQFKELLQAETQNTTQSLRRMATAQFQKHIPTFIPAQEKYATNGHFRTRKPKNREYPRISAQKKIARA
jgi:hypothetical protein